MNPLDSQEFEDHLRAYRADFEPDVTAGLQRLRQRIDQPQQARVRRLPARRWLSVAAAVLLVLAAGFYLFSGDGSTVLSNTTDQPLAVALPDGTSAVLQQGSVLTYGEDFNGTERRIQLDGQAYFEVAKDRERPFTVGTAETQMRVTGTAFNLRIVGDDLDVEVSEGSVELIRDGEVLPVTKHQCGTARPGKACAMMKAPSLNRHAWRTGKLNFNNTPFNEAVRTIAENYGLVIRGGEDCDFPFTGSFTDKDPAAVLETIVLHGQGELKRTGSSTNVFEVAGVCK